MKGICKFFAAWINHAALNFGQAIRQLIQSFLILFLIRKPRKAGRRILMVVESLFHMVLPPQVDHSHATVTSLSKSNPFREFWNGIRLWRSAI